MITLIVEAAFRAFGLGLLVALCLTAFRVRSPHIEKSVWAAVLFASLAMPLLLLIPAHSLTHGTAPGFLVTLRPSAGMGLHIDAGWTSAAATLYWVIALGLFLRCLLGLLRVWYIRRNARGLKEAWTGGLDVRSTASLQVPATFGSTVLLPLDFADWTHDKLAAVMAHERSHVLERDCYLLWLSRLNTCLFWFNPMAWWLYQKIADLAEITSDEAALSTVNDRPAYAEILLEFAKLRPAHGAIASMARPTMAKRIERIISCSSSAAAPALARRWLAVAAFLPAIVVSAIVWHASPLSDAQASETPSDPTAAPRVTSWGGLANLMKYYPPEAKRLGIDGTVDIAVTLDPQGRATNTLILSEDPPDMGFGAAASTVAHTMEYSNPTGHQVQFTFRVKFELRHDAAPTTEDSAAQPKDSPPR